MAQEMRDKMIEIARYIHYKARKGSLKMDKDIFTIKEAADFLQLSKRSLYKLVRGGEIPGRKILNKWRFDRETLKRCLSEGEEDKH